MTLNGSLDCCCLASVGLRLIASFFEEISQRCWVGLYVGGAGLVCVFKLINLKCVLLGVGYQESWDGILWWWWLRQIGNQIWRK